MNRPEDFIISSDYATSKQDDRRTVSITVPGSITISGGSYDLRSQDIVMGSQGSIIRSRISSTKGGGRFYATSQLIAKRFNSSTFMFYSVHATVVRTSPNTLRFMVITPNTYTESLTTVSGSETFTFEVATVIPPVD